MKKVLADFDGVWTDLRGQATAVDDERTRRLAEISAWKEGELSACLDEVAQIILAAPHKYGWRVDGRLTAFADEDPFLMHSAIISAIDILAGEGHKACRRLRDALAGNGACNREQLGSEIFQRGCQNYLRAAGHHLLPEAPAALAALLEVAEVIFCTNFHTQPVAATWSKHGFTCSEPGQGARLTLRGAARKYTLTGDPPRALELGGRQVAVDRGHYRRALLEERPTIVVGDVFSIDLALPLLLRREQQSYGDLLCVLVRTPFTPAWALELCAQFSGQGLRVIDSPAELAAIARDLWQIPRRSTRRTTPCGWHTAL